MPDAYALRAVVRHSLYDHGAAVTASSALHSLRASADVRVNPADLAPLGASDGSTMTLRSPRGSSDVVVRADASVPRGAVVINAKSAEVGAETHSNWLVDATQPVVEIRLESR
jgi:predicted molibdopterin-dependent oxidoreductase YjgC